MTTIDDVLDRIRESSTNTKEVGDRFERLMAAFFRSDRTYKAMFNNVWMWSDWPGNEGKVDTGIDLVVENADGSGYTAIQCKCYAPTNTINKSDIDSFFTASAVVAPLRIDRADSVVCRSSRVGSSRADFNSAWTPWLMRRSSP